MSFSNKLKEEANKAFKEEKRNIAEKKKKSLQDDAKFKEDYACITEKLITIGNNFCKFLSLFKMYDIHIDSTYRSWHFRGHIFLTLVYPEIDISLTNSFYDYRVSFGGSMGSQYQYTGKTSDLSEKSIDEMFIKIAATISRAKAGI